MPVIMPTAIVAAAAATAMVVATAARAAAAAIATGVTVIMPTAIVAAAAATGVTTMTMVVAAAIVTTATTAIGVTMVVAAATARVAFALRRSVAVFVRSNLCVSEPRSAATTAIPVTVPMLTPRRPIHHHHPRRIPLYSFHTPLHTPTRSQVITHAEISRQTAGEISRQDPPGETVRSHVDAHAAHESRDALSLQDGESLYVAGLHLKRLGEIEKGSSHL